MSEDLPLAHSQPVRKFSLMEIAGSIFVFSGGLEGVIRLWRFDPATSSFAQFGRLEGHVRGINTLLLNGKYFAHCRAYRPLQKGHNVLLIEDSVNSRAVVHWVYK